MELIDNLFHIIEKNNTEYIIKLADEKHPIFKAHFPKNPILPGFLQLDIAQKLLNKEFIKFIKVKFIKVITPLSIISYQIKGNKILILQDGKKMSEFIYE